MDSLRVNGERLWRSLMDLARIGATPKGGVKRLALTEIDPADSPPMVIWFGFPPNAAILRFTQESAAT